MPKKREPVSPDTADLLERSRNLFFAQWEELLRLRRTVLKTSDRDDIHDLRVASRRFRAALELYYPFAPKDSKTVLRKAVCKLTRSLGGLRNIDEAQIFFQSRAQADVSAFSAFDQLLPEMRSMELVRIGKVLNNFDSRHLDRMVREMVSGINQESIKERNRFSLLAYFSEVSIRLYLPIHNSLAFSTACEHRMKRHTLRIAIKKWRYFLEIVSQVLGRDYTRILEQLRDYQSLLGRMNDVVEFEGLLGDLKLPRNEQDHLKEVLLAEDALLLEKFRMFVDQKPLGYFFLI